MEKNPELRHAWDFVEHTGISIFLTGKAGTGKTTFLRTLKEKSSKRSVIVAPTGVAAINAGGMTIHSFFQLPFSPYIPNTIVKREYGVSKEKRNIIKTLDLLIIDEISMVRSDLLDAIDSVLRRFKNPTKPFGGVQLLMIGDLQQLTPVVTDEDAHMLKPHYSTPYFFGSHALAQIPYVTIALKHVYRQQEDAFLNILNHVREGRPTAEDMQRLNARYDPNFRPEEDYIRLTTHNAMADNYNDSQLAQLATPSYNFKAEIRGTFPEYSYPTSEILTLKAGAQVMFVKNDSSPLRQYYNGRIGRVKRIDKEQITVHCPGDNFDITVTPQEWENTRYVINKETKEIEPEVQGMFRQYPLRLAWAITVHKSQGLTFNNVKIDFTGGVFAGGQTYVALSRCTSLQGISLQEPIRRENIFVRTEVTNFARNYNNLNIINSALQESKADKQYNDAITAFDKGDMQAAIDNFFLAIHSRYDIEKPAAKRLIRKKLNIINLLKQQLEEARAMEMQRAEQLKRLAAEYTLLGKESEKEGMPQAAIRNYEKALELWPDIPEAKRKLKKLKKSGN